MASMSPINTSVPVSGDSSNGGSVSPRQSATPKNVAFELLFLESPQYRARLPMRVQIYPHDTTDSIVTTVKNFYGLYSGPTGSKGVSFEDEHGNTLIARYENFRNNMVVYVRVIEESPAASTGYSQHAFHQQSIGAAESYYEQDNYQPQQMHAPCYAQDVARPGSTASRRRSPSPSGSRGRRSDSTGTNEKQGRSRSAKDRRAFNHAHSDAYSDSMNGYSSGDGAPSSTSGKSKEQLGTTDISVENIVEGGRRKRAKFESSELPLFAPPQMPAATSNPSVSPARRAEHQRPSLPFVHPGQHPFANPRPMQSPQSYNNVQPSMYATPAHGHRSRDSIGYASNGSGVGSGMGILPTPDPTVGSCMSEEDKDVAIQLMRLGDMSNISHGRTSASTLDDTFSGRADAASSTGATSDGESDSEDELPASRRQRLDASGTARLIYPSTETGFNPAATEAPDASGDDAVYEDGTSGAHAGSRKPIQAKSKPAVTKHRPTPSVSKAASVQKAPKAPRPVNSIKTKKLPATATVPGPMSPASTTHSRKPSVASVGQIPQPGEDEQPDLSTKPRCQRCRKSKKGCDRQRPCGRCRDAGLSADQCISEDEGNGRKGRYGRHMGVPIKKEEVTTPLQPALLPAAPITTAAMTADKVKKRKR
ncbi:Zn(2)-Cys(6) zinc finger domain protein [Metarhizium robertsii]|uniref:Zn(2)-C6 fungal-type DNA-binding domain protein n=2 Tax=Metarhizium robertsii TaxID=568076 RepID=E9F4W3_METRA|nr:Zn(2)-C6 fungal-type DNA-binding domain protein [Metarhizium robertsii ARSEF 23]EFY97295.1 Zn(2)-C6 fungal-type DNA-binding domain protein [Metarhizium robertsii ARSEF 23]EXV00769.1 Zn(2)-Cys(6) zinc finger domain protein [Metarhizium robertsii]